MAREHGNEAGHREMDLFSQLKHMQHMSRTGPRPAPSLASEPELASVRRSLATVLQVLLPYGQLQQRPRLSTDQDASDPFDEDALNLGEPLIPDRPDSANYLLHGKLVEIGPRQRSTFGSPASDAEVHSSGTPEDSEEVVEVEEEEEEEAVERTMAALCLPSVLNLKHNLESLESKNLNNDQVKLLEGQNMISNLRKEFVEDYPKPAGSAAFLHAIRNYRPSHRIRALVSTVPELYRGTNFHDPVYMLAGLGK
uniref:Uncharacterized protein n=1 Tax=Anopheles stephensi TaxID=30069 RepID=A0A182YBU1_ANOST